MRSRLKVSAGPVAFSSCRFPARTGRKMCFHFPLHFMATKSTQPTADQQNNNAAAENNRLDGPSTPMLEAETYGQITDDNKPGGGQTQADMEDDSLRMDREAMSATGPARATDENLPRELTKPSDNNYTLPEEQA